MLLLLKNATFVDWQTLEFSLVNILVEQGTSALKFIDIHDVDALRIKPEELDCTGKLVTRSFGVGHHHAYSALSRGMGAPQKRPQNFHEILKYVWWTLDKCLDNEIIESCALVTAIACAKAGSTFVIDHHASPLAVIGSLETIAKAFDKVGVSHLLCYEISDRDGAEIAWKGLRETEDYLSSRQGLVGLHASFTVSKETLGKAIALMKQLNSGIHIHVAEDAYDQELCIHEHGKRVIERLAEAGALDSSKTILGHCLHLDDNEKKIINESPCWVVQNCESNLNNNVGYFNGTGLGENIILGTDGMHSDMLQSAKAAFFVGQRHDSINYESAYRRFRNIHHYLHDNSYEGDSDNNLVVLDYDSPTPIYQDNFMGHFIFGINSGHVRDVISDGRIIVRDRKVITVDEDEVLKVSQEHARRLWNRMKEARFYD